MRGFDPRTPESRHVCTAPRPRRDVGAEHITEPADGARMQLRNARFVDAQLRANFLHRDFAVVVEANHAALARRQRFRSRNEPDPRLRCVRRRDRALGLGRARARSGSALRRMFSARQGEVDSMVLMRTMVFSRRFSSEPISAPGRPATAHGPGCCAASRARPRARAGHGERRAARRLFGEHRSSRREYAARQRSRT